MAWVRPKHPKRKVEVDPTEALRPVLEYFSCSRPNASNSNNKELIRFAKKPLLLRDSHEARPQKHHYEELEHLQGLEHHARSEHHPRSDHHPSSVHHPRPEQHQQAEHHPRADHHVEDFDRGGYQERASQRSTSHYTREYSPPPPPPPRQVPLPSYRSNGRPGAHLRLMPSRAHIATDTYTPRRLASRWASATTPLEI